MKIYDNFESLPGIYIMKCENTGKYYIGESMNVAARLKSYKYTETRVINRAIRKHGIECFDVYVEYFPNFDKKSLIELEEQLILKFNSLVPNGYNICAKSNDTTGFSMSIENRKKMSERLKGNKHLLGHVHSIETRQKLSRSCSVANNKPEYKEKMSNSLKGRVFSEEHRKKLSESGKGKKFSEEHKNNLSKVRKGVKKSEKFKNILKESLNKRRELLSQDKIVSSLKFNNFSEDIMTGRLTRDKIIFASKKNILSKCCHCGNIIQPKEKIRTLSRVYKRVTKNYNWCNICSNHMADMILNHNYDDNKNAYESRRLEKLFSLEQVMINNGVANVATLGATLRY